MTDVERVFREERGAVLATLIRLLRDVDLAEEALQDAFTAALERWGADPPANPRAWLVSAGRFKAIDRLRRRARFDKALGELAVLLDTTPPDRFDVDDDRLRLVFTCCHPALAPDAQVAMTLRSVCGLTTEEIARAFLTRAPTVAQRIVRAKNRIRSERIPYAVPSSAELPARLDAVLRVVYLVFTEGYAPSAGEAVVRVDLADEAIRLGRLLASLLPDPEVYGLLALMLLQDARRAARTTPDGDLVLLPEQDRALWNGARIAEGAAALRRAGSGPYSLQAAIAAAHTVPPTDWDRVVALYDALMAAQPSPVVALNRAVAVAQRDGPEAGLALIEPLAPDLEGVHLFHAARADLLRRLGRTDDARAAYERALALARHEPQRRFLRRRLAEGQGR